MMPLRNMNAEIRLEGEVSAWKYTCVTCLSMDGRTQLCYTVFIPNILTD